MDAYGQGVIIIIIIIIIIITRTPMTMSNAIAKLWNRSQTSNLLRNTLFVIADYLIFIPP
jgi:hypothetical protein